MYNFNYYTPTKVVFGKDTEQKCGELVKEQGCKKVLIHYGSGSVKRSGLLDKVKASLDEAEVDYIELGGAVPNPRLSLVYEGIELAKKEGVDFILAVGGGSAIVMYGNSMIESDRQPDVFQSVLCSQSQQPEAR